MAKLISSLNPKDDHDHTVQERSGERDFQTFFELSGVGNVVADPETYLFTKVNRTFCEITGYSAEELSHYTSFDLTHPDDRERDRQGWFQCLQSGDTHFEIEKRYIRKNGSIVWVTATSTIVREEDGKPIHAVGVVRDTSAQQKAIAELEAIRSELEDRVARRTSDLASTNRTLEALIDASPLAIIAMDSQFRLTMWNRTAEQLFGWKAEEVIGNHLPNLPDDPDTQKQMNDLFVQKKAFSVDSRRRTKSGEMLEVRVWYAPLHSSNDQFAGYIGLLMDITENRFLEGALLEASEHEQRRIGQDLHDHLCQHLLGAAFAAKALSTTLQNIPETGQLEDLARTINEAVLQMRDVARGLHPVELDSAGLMSSLQELAHRVNYSTPCEFHCKKAVLVENPQTALHVYRIAQEAVGELIHRWGAQKVMISLAKNTNLITIEIRNDGKRTPESKPDQSVSMGEKIMEYRNKAIRGHLTKLRKEENISITCVFSGI